MSIRLIRVIPIVLACTFAQAAEDTWKGVTRIVAVGDVYGDFDQLTRVLHSAGVIDSDNQWSGGKTHLVQTGNLIDRGPDSRKVLGLMMALEKQAHAAGGAVHCLIGNHEAMNLYGDLRYVSPADFASYQTDQSASLRDEAYQRHLDGLRKDPQTAGLVSDDAYRQKWERTHPPGFFERQASFAAAGNFGKWIRGHSTIIRINDMVFLHGGIGPKYARLNIRKINDEVSKELQDFSKLNEGMVGDREGPLWYRGLAEGEEKPLQEHVRGMLERMGAKSMVIGHTPTKGMILPRFAGQVLLIDAGLSQESGSHTVCLVVEAGKAYALQHGQQVTLPTAPAELESYLTQVRDIDTQPK